MFVMLTGREDGMVQVVNVAHIRRAWVGESDQTAQTKAASKLTLFIQFGEDETTYQYVPLGIGSRPDPEVTDPEAALRVFHAYAYPYTR